MKFFFVIGLIVIMYLITSLCDYLYKKLNNWIFYKLIKKNRKKYFELLECEKCINAYFKFSFNKPEQVKECEIMMENLNEAIKKNAINLMLYKSMIIK